MTEYEIRLDERNRWAAILKQWAEFCADNKDVERSLALWDAADALIDDNSEPFIKGPPPKMSSFEQAGRDALSIEPLSPAEVIATAGVKTVMSAKTCTFRVVDHTDYVDCGVRIEQGNRCPEHVKEEVRLHRNALRALNEQESMLRRRIQKLLRDSES